MPPTDATATWTSRRRWVAPEEERSSSAPPQDPYLFGVAVTSASLAPPDVKLFIELIDREEAKRTCVVSRTFVGSFDAIPFRLDDDPPPPIGQPSASLTAPHRMELHRLAGLPKDWDTYGAEAPTPQVMGRIEAALDLLDRMVFAPTRVDPSASNGAGLVFEAGGRYAHVEFLNSGETVVATINEARTVEEWEIGSSEADLGQALETVRAFVRA